MRSMPCRNLALLCGADGGLGISSSRLHQAKAVTIGRNIKVQMMTDDAGKISRSLVRAAWGYATVCDPSVQAGWTRSEARSANFHHLQTAFPNRDSHYNPPHRTYSYVRNKKHGGSEVGLRRKVPFQPGGIIDRCRRLGSASLAHYHSPRLGLPPTPLLGPANLPLSWTI